jgi:predicted protein tyrosine phosphatase
MKQIYKNLFIGNDNDCKLYSNDSEFAIIHACKTCHQKALMYSKSLPPGNQNYLIYEVGNHLFLNLVDMPMEFQPKFTHPIFEQAMRFIDKNINDKKVLIHCNQGLSRSTSLGLVWLARQGGIMNKSYEYAAMEFMKLYPDYKPGNGVMQYMKNNWNYLVGLS